jgi:hypothetical protein
MDGAVVFMTSIDGAAADSDTLMASLATAAAEEARVCTVDMVAGTDATAGAGGDDTSSSDVDQYWLPYHVMISLAAAMSLVACRKQRMLQTSS